ncbi:MAG: glycerophosphodiester phosphodiesterase [Acutalibacteraceae bacterium]
MGDTVDLSAYTYGGTALDEFTWTPVNGGTLDGAEFEAAEKGVYVFDGVKGDESFRLFIVVKAADETEYVLYENTFDDESALDDLTVVEGAESALSIADGKLSVKGTSVRALLPELYADFGNYKIDVEATLQNPSDSSRWMSIMFRATPDGLYYPYYQMAIRSNATAANGVEFAKRTPANGWDVAYKSAYSEAIDPNKFYKFTVCAYDGYVSESINDELLIYGRELTDRTAGRVGFPANNCTMVVDSIKITLQNDVPDGPPQKPALVNVRDFNTNIATTPTMVSFVETEADYNGITTDEPATAIFRLNDEGKVTDAEGKALATLDELYAKLENKIIAAFNPTSEKAIDALAAYCKEKVIEDVAVASTDVKLINYAYEQNYLIRGIVLFDEADYSEEGLLAIREKVNANHAKVAILPYEGISKEVVEYLQKLLVTVWVDAPEAESSTTYMTQILSGANGIVVSDRAAAEKCFTEYFEKNSFTRQILIIGHRGLPSKAPENSIEGSKLAYEAGADIVENDVYISKDGVVVVMHDGTIDRTTNGTGYIEAMTYEQLQQYTLNAVGGIEGAKIPTLEDYFKEFGSLDKHIFIELKSGNQNLLKPVVELIRKYNMTSKVSFISFDTNQLARARALAPEISVGYLCSGLTNTNEPLESVRAAISATQHYSSGLQPKRVGNNRGIRDGLSTADHVLALDLQHAADAARAVLWGINGFNRHASWVTNTAKSVKFQSDIDAIGAGQSVQLDFSAFTYADKETALGDKAEIVIIDGGDNVTLEGNTMTAKGEGSVSFYCRYKTSLSNRSLYVCSDIVTLTTGGAGAESSTAVSDNSETPGTADNSVIIWVVIGVIAVAVIAGVAIVAAKKKKA